MRSTLASKKIYNPQLSLKLFDSIVRPILTYGGEVWAQDFMSSVNFEKKPWEQTPFEKLNTKTCRNILGIRANSSGIAAKAELGRYPIILYLVNQALKFYTKIALDEDKLVYKALQSEIQLHHNSEHSWIKAMEYFASKAGNASFTSNVANIPTTIASIQDIYVKNFFQVINRNVGVDGKSGNKLRTYALMKKEYKLEDYLMADLSRKKATNLAQLRTSAHNLAIETGRYARPAVPSSERKCKMCDLDEVEDEVHFVNRCTVYEEDRRELFGNVGGPQQEASDTDTFVWLMQRTEKEELEAIGKFISKNFQHRKRTP